MTPEHASELAAKVCALAPVIPVLVVDDASVAGALAQALVDGGLPALEVTLRTPAALDVIREMAKIDGGVVGCGHIADVEGCRKCQGCGCDVRRVAGCDGPSSGCLRSQRSAPAARCGVSN